MRERGSPLFLAVIVVLLAMPAQAFDRPLAGLSPSATPTTTDPAAWPELTPTTAPAPPTVNPGPPPLNRVRRTRHILWPVPGYLEVASSWGAERDGGVRLHHGNDIMAPKMTPVVAVANGTIGSIHSLRGDCCWIVLDHDDGWSSWYLHLNNDVLASDNGHGNGIRPDLVPGARVAAGEVIGWVGDSGNAEPGPPHLHFELHMPGVGAIDPYPSLRWARNNTGQPAFAATFAGAFNDDDGLRSEPIFELLTTLGVSTKCEGWGAQVCPSLAATEAETAAWLGAIAGVTVPLQPEMPQAEATDVASELPPCGPGGCPPAPLTRGEALTMVLWAFRQRSFEQAQGYTASAPPAPWDMNAAVALAELQYLGIADVCSLLEVPFDSLLSRAQVAEVIGQGFGVISPLLCGEVS